MTSASSPIGVFDSGIGGLTVAAALRKHLPSERIFYIGDTARVPYGGKSRKTIQRYGIEIGNRLIQEGAKSIVIACNTASALALSHLRKALPVPVIGVVQPGAHAAVQATNNSRIGIIGTRGTIKSRAYERAIFQVCPKSQVFATACPLLVSLIEEGWLDDSITEEVLRRYLAPLLKQKIDTLVLGCTHYPLLKRLIARVVGSRVTLVDSADNCARAVKKILIEKKLAAPARQRGRLDVAFTDTSHDFLPVAAKALGLKISSTCHLQITPSDKYPISEQPIMDAPHKHRRHQLLK